MFEKFKGRSGAFIGGKPQELEAIAYLNIGKNKWPTPCARDYKGPSGPNSNFVGLPKAVQPDPDARPSQKLNSDWVEWLMGFPRGWLD